MKGIKKLYFTVILLMISTLQMMAQQKITGRVIDDDGFAVPYASVIELEFIIYERSSQHNNARCARKR
jgi:hypothetical protein